ncbi:hypothetical protein [Faecalibaculum rodentium]|uniref:hypothetical protein n=2 Tax=Faecalibaculum rodentium TaxID=1702221 RepID=UPI0026F3A62A|nr:hypothetical protein [Faecalibaculum rodentium]
MDLTTEEKGWLEPVHLSCQDPFGNLIVCSVKGHNHLINRHPEMEGCDDEIQSTIENPDKIFTSRDRPDRSVFFRSRGENVSPKEKYNKVVTQKVVPGIECVVSAWFQPNVKGGIASVKYQKPED